MFWMCGAFVFSWFLALEASFSMQLDPEVFAGTQG